MSYEDRTLLAEVGCQAFGEIYGTVATASAADCHGQVAAIVSYEARQPSIHKFLNIPGHILDIAIGVEKTDYILITTGEFTKLRIVVWVRQATHVEYEIGIKWNAVLEPERLEQHDQPGIF